MVYLKDFNANLIINIVEDQQIQKKKVQNIKQFIKFSLTILQKNITKIK